MRKLVLICFVLLLLGAVAGCGGASKDDRIVTLSEVVNELNEENIRLHKTELIKQYRSSTATMQAGYKLDNKEEIYVYLFNNVSEREQGQAAIQEQTALTDFLYQPVYMEADSILIIYMRLSREEGIEPKLQEIVNRLKQSN